MVTFDELFGQLLPELAGEGALGPASGCDSPGQSADDTDLVTPEEDERLERIRCEQFEGLAGEPRL